MVRGHGSVWYGVGAAVCADLAGGSLSVEQQSVCGLSGFCSIFLHAYQLHL